MSSVSSIFGSQPAAYSGIPSYSSAPVSGMTSGLFAGDTINSSGAAGGTGAPTQTQMLKALQLILLLLETLIAQESQMMGGHHSAGAGSSGSGGLGSSGGVSSGGGLGSSSGAGAGTGIGSSSGGGSGTGSAAVASGAGSSSVGGSSAWKNPNSGGDSTSQLQGLIPASALTGTDPIPLNGGANKQAPTTTASLIAPTSEAPNQIATSGPLKGIPNGDALTAAAKAEGVSPYLLAGVAAVETGDNADNRVINDATRKDGVLQVNSGVWNSPTNPGQNADMAAKLIKMYTKEAGGNVAKGLDGYNTGDINQAGFAAKGNQGGHWSSYAAGVNHAVEDVMAYEKSIGNA